MIAKASEVREGDMIRPDDGGPVSVLLVKREGAWRKFITNVGTLKFHEDARVPVLD